MGLIVIVSEHCEVDMWLRAIVMLWYHKLKRSQKTRLSLRQFTTLTNFNTWIVKISKDTTIHCTYCLYCLSCYTCIQMPQSWLLSQSQYVGLENHNMSKFSQLLRPSIMVLLKRTFFLLCAPLLSPLQRRWRFAVHMLWLQCKT